MSRPLDSSSRALTRPLTLALVVLDGFDLVSLSAVLEVIATTRRIRGADAVTSTTLSTSVAPVSSVGIAVTPAGRLGDISLSAFDVVILIGGAGAILQTHLTLSRQLKCAAKSGRLLGGIWNGAYHLAAAGLTEGYECLITGDGRFSIEPALPDDRRSATWQFDEHRMSCRDACGITGMMAAMFDHFSATNAVATDTRKETNDPHAASPSAVLKAC